MRLYNEGLICNPLTSSIKRKKNNCGIDLPSQKETNTTIL